MRAQVGLGGGDTRRDRPHLRGMSTRRVGATPDPGRAGGKGLAAAFRAFAFAASQRLGSHWSFLIAGLVVLGWLASGPLFGYSDTWQLVINTSTTIVTFLMVFLVQATQNRDARALHLKLDELIRTSRARDVFADLEDASEEELELFQREFAELRRRGLDHPEAALEAHARARGRVRDQGAAPSEGPPAQ
jgi:low affinity Fe/Cu permease